MIFEINGTYHFTPEYDFFVKEKVIPAKPSSFNEKLICDDAIIKAIEAGRYSFPKPESTKKLNAFNVISDDLGISGVKNQVDGKMYDSKSALRKSYKANGVVEVGTEKIPEKREQRGDYDARKDIANAMKQLGVLS